jgi:hypothetical protein
MILFVCPGVFALPPPPPTEAVFNLNFHDYEAIELIGKGKTSFTEVLGLFYLKGADKKSSLSADFYKSITASLTFDVQLFKASS